MSHFPLTAEQASEWQARAAQDAGLAVRHSLDLGGVPLVMVLIPPGRFLMGESPEDTDEDGPGSPRHEVSVAHPFYLGETPITQAQWRAVMGSNPARFQGDLHPIERVSWLDCNAFCEQAARHFGLHLRLPSEAEWEYACRAGSATSYSFGSDPRLLDQHGWYRGNAGGRSHPVGAFPPNAWGLYDMHGGIDEFCQDPWHPNYSGAPADGSAWLDGGDDRYRVLRGGSWYDEPQHCRSPHRNYYEPDKPSEDHGFRVMWMPA